VRAREDFHDDGWNCFFTNEGVMVSHEQINESRRVAERYERQGDVSIYLLALILAAILAPLFIFGFR
jgi:hypothetical protein